MTGLLGTYLVLWQLLLMARLPWLEHAFGLERMAVLHKWNGYLAISLLLGHGVFQTLGYQLGDGKDVAAQLADFIQSHQGLLAAIVALILFIAVVGASVTIARRKLNYETWYFVHLYTYLACCSSSRWTGSTSPQPPSFLLVVALRLRIGFLLLLG